MDIILVRLMRGPSSNQGPNHGPNQGPNQGPNHGPAAAPAAAAAPTPSPETVVDVLWAVAEPDDRLEHVRARSGPRPGIVDLAMFHCGIGPVSSRDLALRLSRRALATAPSLSGWVAAAL